MSGFAAMSKGTDTDLIFLASGDKLTVNNNENVYKDKWLNGNAKHCLSESSTNSNESIVTSLLKQVTTPTSTNKIKNHGEVVEFNYNDLKDFNSAAETLNEVHILYRDKMEWIEENIPVNFTFCPNSKSKINLYQMWVEDLREQNQALVEIIRDLDSEHTNQIQSLGVKLNRSQKLNQAQESSLKTLTKEIESLRANTRKLSEEKESIKKSNCSLESKSKHLTEKLNVVELEKDNLVKLLHRIRDEGAWNLDGITISASTFSSLFGEYPDLPGSKIVSNHEMESSSSSSSSSVTSFVHNEKCAELEVLKEELEMLKMEKARVTAIEHPNPPSSETEDGILQVEEFIGNIDSNMNSTLASTSNSKEAFNPVEELARLEKEIQVVLEQNKALYEDFNRERILRKHYYNLVEEMKGKIRVYCRIRPITMSSENVEVPAIVRVIDPFTVGVQTSKGLKEYQFDRIFGPEECQTRFFNEVQSLVQSAFDGYNVCICAYGQTNTGKTHTILGSANDPGIAPRCLDEIFSLALNMNKTTDSVISLYVVELYKQKLIDLLASEKEQEQENEAEHQNTNPVSSTSTLKPMSTLDHHQNQNQNIVQAEVISSDKLEIKRDSQGIVYIQGAHTLKLERRENFDEVLCEIMRKRRTAETHMNQRSSRSHLVIGITIENTSKVNGSVTRGKLSLVDLAGSERNGNFNGPSSIFEESKAINKSLSALEHVIVALTTDQPHIPYRNSKLTELMQDSIGGSAKTLMIVNISPTVENVDESIVSLNYGARVKNVVNKKSVRNFEPVVASRTTPSQEPSQSLSNTKTNNNNRTSLRNLIDPTFSNSRLKSRPSKPHKSAFTAPPTPRSSNTNTNTKTNSSTMFRHSEIWTPRSQK